jgi:phospholipid-binding lipoprotein MlaA
LAVLASLGACSTPPATGILDPYEAQNRKVHDFNVALDRALFVGGEDGASGGGLPEPVGIGLSNLADNAGLPGVVVNDVLQLDLEDAVHNTLRFVINTTVGIGGLFDPAGHAGVEARESDFGETLHVWGVAEGNFLMLPVLGPTTERDAAGRVVDIFIDPVGHILPRRERLALSVVRIGAKAAERSRFSGTISSVLHESADSYSQVRLAYLQNRRFELGQDGDNEDFIDPYSD